MESLTQTEKKALSGIVDRVADIFKTIKEHQEEIKELCVEAAEKCNVRAKNIRKLAREKNFDAEELLRQQEAEDELDMCRVALGLLADTPLGEAAQERAEEQQERKAKGAGKGAKKSKSPTHEPAFAD